MDRELVASFKQFVGSNLRRYGVDFATFEFMLATKLFAASRRRRISEGADGLLQETVTALVDDHLSDFIASQWKVTPHLYRDALIEALSVIDTPLKCSIEWYVRENRNELFDRTLYTIERDGVVIEQHPMETLTIWLNSIDVMPHRNRTDVAYWGRIKAAIVGNLRVGNLAFQRSEWQPKITQSNGVAIG